MDSEHYASTERTDVPKGFCQCGCGRKTRIIRKSIYARGLVAGDPRRFVYGHCKRFKKIIDGKTYCPRCEKIRDIENDFMRSGAKDWCKYCRRQWGRENYVRNRDRLRASRRDRTRKIKRDALAGYCSHKSPYCHCCRITEIEFLTIDHIAGNGREHLKSIKKVSGTGFYAWIIKNKWPAGFRPLCANCNFSLGHYGYCPHQPEEKRVVSFKRKLGNYRTITDPIP